MHWYEGSPLLHRHEKVEEAKREAKRQQELERRFKEGDVSDDSDYDEDKILDEEEAGVYSFRRNLWQLKSNGLGL